MLGRMRGTNHEEAEETRRHDRDLPTAPEQAQQPRPCGKGHRSSLLVQTPEGGAICLVCFSNLISEPSSPSHHVSYALSQMSQAAHGVGGAEFIRVLRSEHGHVLVPPFVQALSSCDDEGIANQVMDLVSDLCCGGNDGSGQSLARDFVARITDRLSSGVLGWSQRQIYLVHCLGILLDSRIQDLSTCIRNTHAVITSLVAGLQLPSEEISGEILFVLYKLSLLLDLQWDCLDENQEYSSSPESSKLLHSSLKILLKTQVNEVRLNCIAFLTVLAHKGHFHKYPGDDTNSSSGHFSQAETTSSSCLVNIFAEAIKGPLLSSDLQVQIAMLDLIFHVLSNQTIAYRYIQVFNEECIADYLFEILRISENRDTLIVSCLRVLDILATEEESFGQRLAIGFPTLLSILHYVAEIPSHPVQAHLLKLVSKCVQICPGVISMFQLEEVVLILSTLLRKYNTGELDLHSETFILVCSTFVEILNSHIDKSSKLAAYIEGASENAVLLSISTENNSNAFIHAVRLLKGGYLYCRDIQSHMDINSNKLGNITLELCESHLLPWLGRVLDEGEEEDVVLMVLETFHLILDQGSSVESRKFAKMLVASSWLTLSYGILGLFPTDRIRMISYSTLSLIVNYDIGQDFGKPIRDSYAYLPSDPVDLIFLLGQKTDLDSSLIHIQPAVILILYLSSLYEERLADDSQILASIEQYLLLNNANFTHGVASTIVLTQLIHVYGFVRSSQTESQMMYSLEAEKILFNLITENGWNLFSVRIHPSSLKWLFEQDIIQSALSTQTMVFCRCYSEKHGQNAGKTDDINKADLKVIADLVLSGDNCLVSILISLLNQSLEENLEDAMCVIDVISAIISICPDASDQFCIFRIDTVFDYLYSLALSSELFVRACLLVFNILRLAHTQSLYHGEAWVAVTIKLLKLLVPKMKDETSYESACILIGIICLILHKCASQPFSEASKAILLNSSLASAVNSVIQICCSKGPALVDHNEETDMGKLLLFILLLFYFALQSLSTLLHEALDWQDFLLPSHDIQSSVICICCHDICRILHFGSSLVKRVASQCLVELLTRISHYKNITNAHLKCSVKHLQSMIAVTEGFIFYEDSIVAANCGICLSKIIGWANSGIQEKKLIYNSKWCRLIMEELTLILASPGLVSTSFSNNHKPATLVAAELLKLHEVPDWLMSILDNPCISSIIDKLSASNVSAELVVFFKELLINKRLSRVQACRKQIYSRRLKENCLEVNPKKAFAVFGITDMFRELVDLMISLSKECVVPDKQDVLLKEIEMFIKESADNDNEM